MRTARHTAGRIRGDQPISPQDPDLCVVGGGTAGHPLAFAAAALGLRCTLIDPRDRLGAGQAADLAEAALVAAGRRHRPGEPFDLVAFRRHLGHALADAAPTHAAARLRSAGVTLVRGTAHFADSRTVMADGRAIRARRFVLATGADPAPPPPQAAIDPARLVTFTGLLRLPRLPPAITILIDSPAGLALAQALGRLGSAVTLVAAPGFEAPFDPELMAVVLAALRRDGVRLDRDHDAAASDRGAATLLIVTRPVPAIGALGLADAGIACAHGAPIVDAGLRTINRGVYAMGAVLGRLPPGGAAIQAQVGLVLRAVGLRQPGRYRPGTVIAAIATEPPLAQVGTLDPGPHGKPRHVLRAAFAEDHHPSGLVKIVAGRGGAVVGAGAAGPGAAEALAPWALAVADRLPARRLAAIPVPVGGVADALRRAALSLLAGQVRRPLVKRLIALVQRLP